VASCEYLTVRGDIIGLVLCAFVFVSCDASEAADVQFVLHHASRSDRLPARVQRADASVTLKLELSAGWRPPNLAWRGSLYGMPPEPGLWLEPAKNRNGIAEDKLALQVRGLFKAPVRKAGLKEGDLVVAVDGEDQARSPGAVHEYLVLHCSKPGAAVEFTVLRSSERLKLRVVF
jgi:hypothetical protein